MRCLSVCVFFSLLSCGGPPDAGPVIFRDTLTQEPVVHQPYLAGVGIPMEAGHAGEGLPNTTVETVTSDHPEIASVVKTANSSGGQRTGINFQLNAVAPGEATISALDALGRLLGTTVVRVAAPDGVAAFSLAQRRALGDAAQALPMPLVLFNSETTVLEVVWTREGTRLWGKAGVEHVLESSCQTASLRPHATTGMDMLELNCSGRSQVQLPGAEGGGGTLDVEVVDSVASVHVELHEAAHGDYSTAVVDAVGPQGQHLSSPLVTLDSPYVVATEDAPRWKQGDFPNVLSVSCHGQSESVVIHTHREAVQASNCQGSNAPAWGAWLGVLLLRWRRQRGIP